VANEENRISTQIAVYKTDKKLVEFNDKLQPASVENYAHLHATTEEADGKKLYSLIGMVMQDYSNGTGDKLVRVSANLSPDDIGFILCRLTAGFTEVDYSQDKIFGKPDAKGLSTVTKVVIKRATVGSDGNPRKYPWYFCVENGTGIAAENKSGGKYIQSKSYVKQQQVFANLSDLDAYRLFNRVAQYVKAWELTNGPRLIRDAAPLLAAQREEYRNAQKTA
jgi:hypothetical protein